MSLEKTNNNHGSISEKLNAFINAHTILCTETANTVLSELVEECKTTDSPECSTTTEKSISTLEFNHLSGKISESSVQVSVNNKTGRSTWYFNGERVSKSEVLDCIAGNAIIH